MANKISFDIEFINAKGNLDDAKGVLNGDWGSMTQAEQDNWLTNKVFTGDVDGNDTFLDYFLRGFSSAQSNNTRFSTVSLSAGTSNNYVDRATRVWSAS